MKQIYFSLFACFLFVNAIYAQPAYVPSNGLVAWWGFNGDSQDQSGNGNHLGAGANPPTLTVDRFNASNSAYAFNGANMSFSMSNFGHTFSHTGSFSVSIWVYKLTNNSETPIMSGTVTSGNFIWNIQTNTSTTNFSVNKQGSSWFRIFGPAFTVSTWEHYVGVFSNGAMSFYKDGVLVGTETSTHTSVSSAVLPLYVGKAISGSFFHGSLDDIGIWDRVLTQTEITQLYQSTLNTENFSLTKSVVYPNPSSNEINITFPEERVGEKFEIYDELGRVVYSNTVVDVNNTVNISDLANGIYMLKATNDTNAIKFVKN